MTRLTENAGMTSHSNALETPDEVPPRTGIAKPDIDEKRDSGPVLRTFFRIVEAWKVGPETAMTILGTPRATYYKWKKAPNSARLSRDQFERLSYVFGIYKALQILLPSPENADSWVTRPNQSPVFGGRSPLDRMAAGNVSDLYEVRRYLDAERGW